MSSQLKSGSEAIRRARCEKIIHRGCAGKGREIALSTETDATTGANESLQRRRDMKVPFLWELPDEIKKRFGERGAGRQRAMIADGHLLLVLHRAPRHNERDRRVVFYWRKPTGEWESSGKGEGLRELRRHIEEYGLAEERLSKGFDQAEEAEEYFQILQEVAPLHHAANNLHTTLQTARVECSPFTSD